MQPAIQKIDCSWLNSAIFQYFDALSFLVTSIGPNIAFPLLRITRFHCYLGNPTGFHFPCNALYSCSSQSMSFSRFRGTHSLPTISSHSYTLIEIESTIPIPNPCQIRPRSSQKPDLGIFHGFYFFLISMGLKTSSPSFHLFNSIYFSFFPYIQPIFSIDMYTAMVKMTLKTWSRAFLNIFMRSQFF